MCHSTAFVCQSRLMRDVASGELYIEEIDRSGGKI